MLASNSSKMVTVLLGAQGAGFAVFADVPASELPSSDGSAGVMDVALADVDNDDENDLIALLDDGFFTVRLGLDADPFFESEVMVFSTSIGGSVARDQVLPVDIDCDNDLDLVFPSDAGVIAMMNDGAGAFQMGALLSSGVSLGWVAAGDLDHDDDFELVASASDRTVKVWDNDCGIFGSPDSYGKPTTPGTYDDTRVVLARICPSTVTSLDLIYSYGDTIDAFCGEGSGNFGNVQESHGQETTSGADFQWTVEPVGASLRYADLAVVGGGATQQVLALDVKDLSLLALVPSTCRLASLAYPITLNYGTFGNGPFSRIAATRDPSSSGHWERVSIVGGNGLQVLR